jgi:hypothetical protein
MLRKHLRKRTHPKPKAVLRLPDLAHAKSAVLNRANMAPRLLRTAAEVGVFCTMSGSLIFYRTIGRPMYLVWSNGFLSEKLV